MAVVPSDDPQSTGVYEVDAEKVTANDGSIYGLIFGLDTPEISVDSNFYAFWIDSANQRMLCKDGLMGFGPI